MKTIWRYFFIGLLIATNLPCFANTQPIRTLGVVLFPNFELLDVTGPLEMFGQLPDKFKIILIAEKEGPVNSIPGVALLARATLKNAPHLDLLLIPGGEHIQQNFSNQRLLTWIKQRSTQAELTLTVCTGSALLAKTGLLDHHHATTNKMAFTWVVQQRPQVKWQKHARWVDDGKFVTSSGVAAGVDMSLHVIARLYGIATGNEVANRTEYIWNKNPAVDPFAKNIK